MTYPQQTYADTVEGFLESPVRHADFLCVTLAASQYHKLYRDWKDTDARCVAIDEAACMSRVDLCCVWGNTLTPSLLFGDLRQLPPIDLTKSDKIPGTDHLVSRFSVYGEVSAMSALLASRLPVYRLKVQLRMTRGMFDLVAKVTYPDVPFTYHGSRAINNPEFKVEHGIDGCFHAEFPELNIAVLFLKHGSGSTNTP